jgi:hypothetical protein
MNCPKCNADISPSSKFCNSCGAAILEIAPKPAPVVPANVAGGALFSESEIKSLVTINEKMVKSGGKQSSVSQDDIDKLFG